MIFLILFFLKKKEARLKNKDIKIIQVHFVYCIEAEYKPNPPFFLLSFANQLDNEAICTVYIFCSD